MLRPAIANKLVGIGALIAAAIGLGVWLLAPRTVERDQLGLVTSLPIYWADGADISALLDENAELPWVRQVLEQRYHLRPVDRFEPGQGGEDGELAGLDRLLLVQPRGISPEGNVALDRWVQGGGHLLYVIDPLLSGEYSAPLGDPRHPSVIGLIPPVLPRWGVTMAERAGQPEEPHLVTTPFGEVPVMQGGRLVASPEGTGDCTIAAGELIARCTVGKGRVTVLADATLFELVEGSEEQAALILKLGDYAFR